jgi:hypothetical protein
MGTLAEFSSGSMPVSKSTSTLLETEPTERQWMHSSLFLEPIAKGVMSQND